MELISFEPCQKLPPHLPEGLSAVRCKVKGPSGILFDVILGGPQHGKATHDCLASGARFLVAFSIQYVSNFKAKCRRMCTVQ